MTMSVIKMQTLAKVQRYCDAMMQSRMLTRADARIQPSWQSEKQVNRTLQEIHAKMSVDQPAAAATRVEGATSVEEEL